MYCFKGKGMTIKMEANNFITYSQKYLEMSIEVEGQNFHKYPEFFQILQKQGLLCHLSTSPLAPNPAKWHQKFSMKVNNRKFDNTVLAYITLAHFKMKVKVQNWQQIFQVQWRPWTMQDMHKRFAELTLLVVGLDDADDDDDGHVHWKKHSPHLLLPSLECFLSPQFGQVHVCHWPRLPLLQALVRKLSCRLVPTGEVPRGSYVLHLALEYLKIIQCFSQEPECNRLRKHSSAFFLSFYDTIKRNIFHKFKIIFINRDFSRCCI